MANLNHRICPSRAVSERGPGVRFECISEGQATVAFVIRHEGIVRAFQNRCPHLGHELDWNPGHFYDREGHVLVCASHGARYDPATGACLSGPCRGSPLQAIAVGEAQGWVSLSLMKSGV